MPQSAWGIHGEPGMSLRQWYAGQALANPSLLDRARAANQDDLRRMFGTRMGITYAEIVARLAIEFADALIAENEIG